MTAFYLLLLALSAACFLSSTFGFNVYRAEKPVNLASLGLFLWVLVPLIETIRNLN